MSDGDRTAPADGEIDRVRGELADLAREAEALTAGAATPGTDLVPSRSADPTVAKRQMVVVAALGR